MAFSRCAPALLRRSLRLAESASPSTASGARRLVSLSVLSGDRTGSSGNSERKGWRTRAGVVGGGVAAVTGFMSLLQLQQPVVSRSESVQQIEAPVAREDQGEGERAARIILAMNRSHGTRRLAGIRQRDRAQGQPCWRPT